MAAADSHKTVRVLVVDDEPSITEFVSYALAREGYAPEIAASAEEALVLAEHNRYDLFILDVMLPGMDGYTSAAASGRFPTRPCCS